MSAYIADQSWPEEPQRLNQLEHALDAHTTRYLQALGVTAGMSCLEIGAGTGSIARWLAERVGATGQVVATDLEVAALAPLERALPNLSIRQEDITAGVPRGRTPEGFHVAHARLVLGHLNEPERALGNVLSALQPGGFALIEDADFLWTQLGEQPLWPRSACAPYFTVWSAAAAYMQRRGYDVHWGRRLAGAMRDAGFVDVAGEAVIPVGDQALQAAMRLTIARFAPALIEERAVTQAEVEACLALLADPSLSFTGAPTFSVWGRRGT